MTETTLMIIAGALLLWRGLNILENLFVQNLNYKIEMKRMEDERTAVEPFSYEPKNKRYES